MTNNVLEIYSKGLYSSWCYHIPSRTLFDCGEGFASHQGNFIYGVERIMISHGHGDHVLGLPSLIGCRNSARGDKEKPLEIYYPHGDKLVENVRDFCNLRNSNTKYQINWHPIMHGFSLDLGNNQEIEAFEMVHQLRGKLTLGYRIVEKRHKLREEFVGKNIPELLKQGIVKPDELKVWYTANTFAYCLDAYDVHNSYIKDCDVVVMDCTFLDHEDRDAATHYTLTEAYNMVRHANVKHMIAAHFSPRYRYPDIKNAVEKLNKLDGGAVPYITPVYHNNVLSY